MSWDRQQIARHLETACPQSYALVGATVWAAAVARVPGERASADDVFGPFIEALQTRTTHPYAAELARLELLRGNTDSTPAPVVRPQGTVVVNPTLQVVAFAWSGLVERLADDTAEPQPGQELLLCWKPPEAERARLRPAAANDLLALKLVVEDLDPPQVARAEETSPTLLHGVLRQAQAEGLLLTPPSSLRRDPGSFRAHADIDTDYATACAFTLQWHVTHACDLHCRHCYDRSLRSALTLDQGLRLLDDLYRFCQQRGVQGQVTFTGGNPLLLPDFDALYRAAVERGFLPAILGNPAPRERLERLVAIETPDFYQVSLEGLRDHNDFIRGAGHFDRVLAFLPLLRELGIHAMVMLTLTRDNQDQVLPLAELLRDQADTFHFNRLSPVGEGAQLPVAETSSYATFLETYLEAAQRNPILGLKDNLFNLLLQARGDPVFGGCTGHGCGAAFNFLSVLPDGETHACRKFPSPVGNVLRDGIAAVYDSAPARRYRRGSTSCRSCNLHTVCGGCLASAHGLGLDPLAERDPYCFAPTAATTAD